MPRSRSFLPRAGGFLPGTGVFLPGRGIPFPRPIHVQIVAANPAKVPATPATTAATIGAIKAPASPTVPNIFAQSGSGILSHIFATISNGFLRKSIIDPNIPAKNSDTFCIIGVTFTSSPNILARNGTKGARKTSIIAPNSCVKALVIELITLDSFKAAARNPTAVPINPIIRPNRNMPFVIIRRLSRFSLLNISPIGGRKGGFPPPGGVWETNPVKPVVISLSAALGDKNLRISTKVFPILVVSKVISSFGGGPIGTENGGYFFIGDGGTIWVGGPPPNGWNGEGDKGESGAPPPTPVIVLTTITGRGSAAIIGKGMGKLGVNALSRLSLRLLPKSLPASFNASASIFTPKLACRKILAASETSLGIVRRS